MLQKGSSLGKGAPYIQCMVARQQPPKAFVSRCLQGFAAHLGMILGLFSGRGFGSGQRVNGEKRRSDREILPPATNPGGSGGYFMLRGRDYTDFFRTGGLSWLLQEHVTYLHNNIYILRRNVSQRLSIDVNARANHFICQAETNPRY